MKRATTLLLIILLFTLAFAGTVLAGTDTQYYPQNDTTLTLTFPDDMTTCTPTFHFTTEGVGADWTVEHLVRQMVNGGLVDIGWGSSIGELNATFTPEALQPGSTETYAVFVAVYLADGTLLRPKMSGQWHVTCEETPPPPPQNFQGCTPGYWKQDQHFDSWPSPFAPDDSYNAAFGVSGSFDTLLAALWARGGQENALARHAVAALLNASNPDVYYAYTADEIIAGVQAAYASGDFESFKNALDTANNAGCPLN